MVPLFGFLDVFREACSGRALKDHIRSFVCSVETWAVSDSIENMKICCAICGCIDTVCEFIVEAFAEIFACFAQERREIFTVYQ